MYYNACKVRNAFWILLFVNIESLVEKEENENESIAYFLPATWALWHKTRLHISRIILERLLKLVIFLVASRVDSKRIDL